MDPSPGLAGVLVPGEAVNLSSEWGGRLVALQGRMGEAVQAGAVIARLDRGLPGQEVEAAGAALEVARSEALRARLALRQARALVARLKPLVAQGFTSREELAAARAAAAAAGADLARGKARMRQQSAEAGASRLRAEGFEVRAPFDALVSLQLARPGQVLRPGDPIVRLIRRADWRVRFAVPEEAVTRIQPGLQVSVRAGQGGPLLQGRVDAISPELEPTVRMVLAEAALESIPERHIPRAGSAVWVLLPSVRPPGPAPVPVGTP